MSYSKTCDTFRASDHTAVGTGLGSHSFVNFNKSRPVPSGFVSELRFQHSPTCVQNRLSHSGFCKLGRTDVADDDKCVFTSDFRGPLVEMVAPRIGDFSVDNSDASLVTRALGNSERRLVLAVVPQSGNNGAVCASSDSLQSEINTDLAIAGRQIVGNLALKTDIPAPASVLHEAASLERAVDIARLPEVKFALEVDDVRAIDLQGTRDKRYPAKSPLRAAAGAETRAAFVQIARRGELAADCLYSVGVQAEVSSAAGAEINQIKGAWPFAGAARLPSSFGLTLYLAAVVPDLVHRKGVPPEAFSCSSVLNTVFERQHHASKHNWYEVNVQDYGGVL